MKLIVYTDGASRGNPGPAAYGFTISDESEKLVYKAGRYIGITTNNVAEYTAVLKALSWIRENIKKILQIEVFADSKLVSEQLSGRYKIKAKHLKPIIGKIQFLSLELGGVVFSHVPRSKNTLADKLANLALDRTLERK